MKLLLLAVIAVLFVQTCRASSVNGSHWCCNIDLKPEVKEETVLKPVRKTKIVTKKVIIDYEPCKDEDPDYDETWSKSCPVYEIKKTEVAFYKMENVVEKTVVQRACPDENVVCCGDLVLFEDNCYEESQVDELKMLKELGIIGK